MSRSLGTSGLLISATALWIGASGSRGLARFPRSDTPRARIRMNTGGSGSRLRIGTMPDGRRIIGETAWSDTLSR